MADIKKMVEEIKTLSVLELNELVKAIEEEFGVAASAMFVAGAGGGAGGGAGEAAEKSEFNVILKEVGNSKMNVIKLVKEVAGLGLKEAKEIVDGAPSTIKENVPEAEAKEMEAKFKEAGATVELK